MNDIEEVVDEVVLMEKPQAREQAYNVPQKDWLAAPTHNPLKHPENTENSLSQLAEFILNATDMDTARIEQIKEEIAAGTYEISSHFIAKSLLSY